MPTTDSKSCSEGEEVWKVQQCSLTFCLKCAKNGELMERGEIQEVYTVLLTAGTNSASERLYWCGGFPAAGSCGRELEKKQGCSVCQSFCYFRSASVCLLCRAASVGERTNRGQCWTFRLNIYNFWGEHFFNIFTELHNIIIAVNKEFMQELIQQSMLC